MQIVNMAGKPPAIEVKGLVKKYGGRPALDGVDLTVGRGELFGLLGSNGAGKTTMIRAMTGQTGVDAGTVSVGGIDALRDPVKVREISGIVPEQESPPSFLSAREYLDFVAMVRGLGDVSAARDGWFRNLSFHGQEDMLCKDLSRGTRQKLMIIQAFIHEPRIAFIDEPLINLDPVMQKRVKDYLKAFVRRGGTVFLSTHVLEIAEEICTRIAILDKGRIIHEGPVSGLKRKKKHLEGLFLSMVSE
jgi:ABC-2 type transport system ATP-binding protein